MSAARRRSPDTTHVRHRIPPRGRAVRAPEPPARVVLPTRLRPDACERGRGESDLEPAIDGLVAAVLGDELVRLGALTGLLRRRWPSLVFGAVTALGAAAAYLRWTPPVYEANTLLRVDAKQGTLPAVYTTFNDVNRAASEAEVLRSRAIASAAARYFSIRSGGRVRTSPMLSKP